MALNRPFVLGMPYLPYLTFPASIFSSPTFSTLLPIVLGFSPGFLVDSSSKDKENGFATIDAKFKALKRPPLSPPGWIFPVVWAFLYPSMGYAAYRAWTTGMASANPSVHDLTQRGATLYTLQIAVNLCFTPLYFGLGKPVAGLINIATLTGMVYYLAYLWKEVDSTATYLLFPYMAWLSFATYLCAAQGYLNGWDFGKNMKRREGKAE